ncbi:MAG: NusG domain II-containing protein [Fibrobacterota bacterium]
MEKIPNTFLKIRPLDILIAALIILPAVFFLLIKKTVATSGHEALIYSRGELFYKLKIEKTGFDTVRVAGTKGHTVFVRDSSGLRAVSSPCPFGHCLRQSPAISPGDQIICVPNKVRAVIKSRGTREIDAVSE